MTILKSGKQIADNFFEHLDEDTNLDKDIVEKVIDLYDSGKLTSTAIGNALEELRSKELKDENK